MQLDAFILADAISTPPDGKFYVHGGGISRLEVPRLPWQISLAALARLRVADDEAGQTVRIMFTLIGPTGQPNVEPMEAEVKLETPLPGTLLPGEERFGLVAAQVVGIAVRTGLYRVEFEAGDTVRAVASFPLVAAEGPQEIDPGAELLAMVGQLPPPATAPATRPVRKRSAPSSKKAKH